MNLIKNSKKGSYIMEAAIVLPVVMVVVITVVLIVMFFYSQMSERSKLHMELRAVAGKSTGKTAYLHESGYRKDFGEDIYANNKNSGGRVYGKKYIIMTHRGVLGKKGVFVIEGSCHAVDAVQYVRFYNLVKDIKNE